LPLKSWLYAFINFSKSFLYIIAGVKNLVGLAICIYIGNEEHSNLTKGAICLYGWLRFDERYTHDAEGNELEYFQDDVYGFSHIAADFSKFLEILVFMIAGKLLCLS